MRRSSVWLGVLLVAGFVVRLWAMRWPPFPFDMTTWIAWGERMREVGPQRFYDPNVFTDYAPGYMFVMWLTAAVKHTLFPASGAGMYHFLYRFPPIVCDLLTAALIYNVLARAQHTSQRAASPLNLALLGAAIHLFNPLVILNGAVWGQIDATFTFAMVLALVLVLRGYAVAAVLAYVVALLIKPQAIALAPVVAILLLVRYPWRRWLTAGAAGVALGFVLIAPFLGWGSYLRLVQLLGNSVEVYPYTSLFTYNLWGVYGFWKDDRVASFAGMSLRSLGTLLYVIGIAYGAWWLVRALRRGADSDVTAWASASYFIFLPVMVLTRMHERYLYPLFPFLLVWALLCIAREQESRVRGQDVRSTNRHAQPALLTWLPLGLYVVLAVLHTFNLYQVYVFYLFYDRQTPIPASHWLYYFVEPRGKLWSLLTVAGFMAVAALLPWWSRVRTMQRAARGSLAAKT